MSYDTSMPTAEFAGGRGTDPARSGLTPRQLSDLALQMYRESPEGLTNRAGEARRKAGSATRALRWVAITNTISPVMLGVLGWLMNRPSEVIFASVISQSMLAALFWALCLWSARSPLVPAIAGLVAYLTFGYVRFFQHAALLTLDHVSAAQQRVVEAYLSGMLIRIPAGLFTLTLLITAIVAGVRHRRLLQRAVDVSAASKSGNENPVAVPQKVGPRRWAGVTTGLLLYLGLFYWLMNIPALAMVGYKNSHAALGTVFAMSVMVIVWSIACWRDTYRPLTKPIHPGWYYASVPLGVCTFVFAAGWLYVIQYFANLPFRAGGLPMSNFGFDWSLMLVLVCVQPALIEELAFRGVMFGGFERTLGARNAMLLTAVLFGVLHLNPIMLPHLLVMGLVAGFVRLRSGSWLPGVFMHFTHNFICLMAAGRGF